MMIESSSETEMSIVAYEHLTDHGLALPLFATSTAANALYIAVPSIPGEPSALIRSFEVYSSAEAKALDGAQIRSASKGGNWIDVLIWHDRTFVGTRAELWDATVPHHDEMEQACPLSLLALAEGVGHPEAARCAAVAYEWLEKDWGRGRADRWRIDSYLTRLARRDLVRRCFSEPQTQRVVPDLTSMRLSQYDSILELRLPRFWDLKAEDLVDLGFAANALGWRVEIKVDSNVDHTPESTDSEAVQSLVMRLRHGRGRTQTQIPLRVVDSFFRVTRTLRDQKTGRLRTMTLSKAGEARNTMKLQLPEIAQMVDPVARFERRDNGVFFGVYDANSPEGREIADLLSDGISDGSTKKTQRGATWWRFLSDERKLA